MANSMAILSRRVCRSLLSNSVTPQLSMPFCTTTTTTTVSSSSESPDSDIDSNPDSPPLTSSKDSKTTTGYRDNPLENGFDVGIHKAILVGQVGQPPMQKKLKNGKSLTMFSLGTGGIRNNRRPHENEDPVEYANRCAVQWHRVCVYPQMLGGLVLKKIVPGATLYLEGNMETKIFTDPITGMVRRIREIAIRRNGRIVFLGNSENANPPNLSETKRAGYY